MENRVKILIADGNEEFCAHVKRRLEQVSGYEIVGTAADGQRAVELMRAAKPDVLVLDLMLSKLDGITVLKRAREMDKPPAALVLTGFMTEYVAGMAASLGVQYFIDEAVRAGRRSRAHPRDDRDRRPAPPVGAAPAGGQYRGHGHLDHP